MSRSPSRIYLDDQNIGIYGLTVNGTVQPRTRKILPFGWYGGKLERYHQTLKRDVNQLPYELPSDLEASIVAFVSYYNYRAITRPWGT